MGISKKYYEELYFNSGDDRDLLPQNQDAIIELLDINGAVGVFGFYKEPDYPIYFTSGFALTALGYSFEEMIDASEGKFVNLIYEKDRQSFLENMENSELKSFEFRVVHSSGKIMWIKLYRKNSTSFDEHAIVVASMRVVDDTRKRESELLAALTKNYNRIIYVDVNQGKYRIIKNENIDLGGQDSGTIDELKEILRRYSKKHIHPDDYSFDKMLKVLNLIAHSKSGGGNYQTTFRAKIVDEYQWVQFQAIYGGAMNLDTGHIILTFRIVDDEKKKELDNNKILSESLAREKDARAAKIRFLSRMSHDLRTPINGIAGMLEIAKSNKGNQDKIDECLEKISLSCENLISLVQDVLDMNNLENGEMEFSEEAVDLLDLFESELKVFAERAAKSGLTYETDYTGLTHTGIIGSPKHIMQIFEHILDNAIKYNNPNGKVRLSGREISKNEKTILYEFVIEDTGVGIAPDFIDKIYEPFEQEHGEIRTKYIGTGLGMSIVKILVDRMNGEIDVISKQGEGTRVTVKLPFKLARIVEDETESTEEIDFSKINVLLVEDNEMNMEIAKFLLESAGMNVYCAVDGKEAVDAFAGSKVGEIQVILMDIMMPVMDGLEAAREIRGLEREDADKVSIIALSANVMDSDIKMSKMAGMDEHLPKPINTEQLFSYISKSLHKNKQ